MQKNFSHYQDKIAKYSKALAHPIRVHILELLQKENFIYSGDIAKDLPIARSTLSQHIKDLKEAGLIEGKYEPPKIAYSIHKKNWEEAKRLLITFFG